MTIQVVNEFTPIARHFCRIRHLHIHVVRADKKKSEELQKRSKKDEKTVFGPLVETASEKRKRLKTKNKDLISCKKAISDKKGSASELLWSLGSSTKLKIISYTGNKGELSKNNIESSATDKNAESNLSPSNENFTRQNESDKNMEPKVKANPFIQNNAELPDIVIRKLPSFSIFDNTQKPRSNTDDNEILSLSATDDKAHLCFPSVTRILSATMSEEARLRLQQWKEKMIKNLGEAGFEKYQKDLLANGKLLHSAIENTLTGKPFDVSKAIEPAFASLKDVFKNIDEVRALESHVVHPKLKYRGIIDCVASYRGTLCLIDWKKSDKLKPTINSTYDAPLQLASYIGALNVDVNYPFEITKGRIIVAYTTGETATVHEVGGDKLQLYWRLWLQRLQTYHENKQTSL